MKTEFITTKVRPFRKLFVVDANDFSAFSVVIKSICDEVDQIFNLIFVNDDLLWSKVTLEFVRRHDPDIILNLSKQENSILEKHFEVVSVSPNTDQWKISRFSTKLWGMSNLPNIFQRIGATVPSQVFAADRLQNDPRSIFDNINFGFVEDIAALLLDASIFKSTVIEPIKKDAEIFEYIFDHNHKFCHLTTAIGFGSGGGFSIYEKDYNEKNYFRDGKYIFVGRYLDLSSLCYFWNTRATYGFADLAWVPLEILDIAESIIGDDITFVVTDEIVATDIAKRFDGHKLINADQYFFSGSLDRWKCFEIEQTVIISGESVVIQHPAERHFSDMGMCGACVLEVRGFKEHAYPVRAIFWNLYRPDRAESLMNEMLKERFYRLSERGLSHYCLQVPFDEKDTAIEVKLPKFPDVVSHLFNGQGLSVHRTNKTAILEQLINLVGGLHGAKDLCQQQWFELIVSLTPTKRTEKALRKILGSDPGSTALENILEIVGQARNSGAIDFPEKFSTAKGLADKANVSNANRNSFFKNLQYFYEKRVFLRGKNFSCSHCSSNVWLSLDSLQRVNLCPECGNETSIPVLDREGEDYYKLNQLLVRAVDQGQMATLLVLNIFFQQNFRIFDFLSNLEVKKDNNLLTDIDLFLRIGKKLGVAECKSGSGFDSKQIDSLIEISACLKGDFVVLSSLLSSTSEELIETARYINSNNLEIPILIFSKEALFSLEPIKIYKYFQSSRNGDFPKGAIFVR